MDSIGFKISWFEVTKRFYRDIVSLSLTVIFPIAVVLWILTENYIQGGWKEVSKLSSTNNTLTLILILLIIPLLPLLVALLASLKNKGYYGYVVKDGFLYLSILRIHVIPINEAEIRLVSFKTVKPLAIKHGVRLTGFAVKDLHIGYSLLVDGEWAHVFIYGRSDKAMLVIHRGKRFVISHPGIEHVYNILRDLKKNTATNNRFIPLKLQ